MSRVILKLILTSGYFVGIGIEAAIALVAGVLLVLLLANVFVKREEKQTESGTSLMLMDGEVVQKDEETVTAVADAESVGSSEAVEAVPVGVLIPTEDEPKKEEPEEESAKAQPQPIIINVYNGAPAEQEGKKEEQAKEPEEEKKPEEKAEPEEEKQEAEGETEEDGDKEVVQFKTIKTVEELYAELSPEQQSFFDELKSKAMAKPHAVLSVTKNYENVKIGKRSIIKLLIRKGVTVAEFLLENDMLKEYRKNSANKKGKSKIRIRPTVISITELATLKTALDMIDLAYEQIIED